MNNEQRGTNSTAAPSPAHAALPKSFQSATKLKSSHKGMFIASKQVSMLDAISLTSDKTRFTISPVPFSRLFSGDNRMVFS